MKEDCKMNHDMKRITVTFLSEQIKVWSDDKFPDDVDYLKVGSENIYYPQRGELFYHELKKKQKYLFIYTGTCWVPAINAHLAESKQKQLYELGFIMTFNGDRFHEWSLYKPKVDAPIVRTKVYNGDSQSIEIYANKDGQDMIPVLYEIFK
jgi:hypothetical protein